MAALPDNERLVAWAEYMRRLSDDRETIAVTKADLRAAVDAIDDFLEANAATMNQAIPQPARAALTTKQKALLLVFVIQRRYLQEA